MSPERPSEAPEQPVAEPEYLKQADSVRQKLLPGEDPASWKRALEAVAKPPDAPADNAAPGKNPMHLALQKDLHTQWLNISQILEAVVKIDAKDLTETRQKTALRHLAKYLQTRQQYLRVVHDKIENVITPKLAPYLELSPEELAAEQLTDRLLSMQYDVVRTVGLAGKPKELAAPVSVILFSAMRQKLKADSLQKIVEAVQADPKKDEAHKLFLRQAGLPEKELTPENIAAVKLLAGYAAKNWSKLPDALRVSEYPTLDTLPIDQALLYLGDVGAGVALQEIAIQISVAFRSGHTPDLAKVIEKMDQSGAMFSPQAAQVTLSKFVPSETKQQRDQAREDAAATVAFSRSPIAKATPVRGITGFIDGQNRGVQAMVTGSAGDIQKNASSYRTRLLQASFLKPSGADAELYGELDTTLTKLLDRGEAKFHPAFELYMLLEQGDRSTILQPLKLHDFLVKNGEAKLANSLEAHLIAKYSELAKKAVTSADLSMALDEFKLSERQKTEVSNASEYLRDEGVAQIEKWWDKFYKVFSKNPELLIIFAPTALWVLAKVTKGVSSAVRFRAKQHGVSVEQLRVSQGEVAKLLAEYDIIQNHRFGYTPSLSPSVTQKARDKYLIRQEARAIHNAFLKPAELNELAGALKGRFGPREGRRFADTLAPMVDNDASAVEGALRSVGYSEADAKAAVAHLRVAPDAGGTAPKATVRQPTRPTTPAEEIIDATRIDTGKMDAKAIAELAVKLDIKVDGRSGADIKTDVDAALKAGTHPRLKK
jgi:hypothetical protein